VSVQCCDAVKWLVQYHGHIFLGHDLLTQQLNRKGVQGRMQLGIHHNFAMDDENFFALIRMDIGSNRQNHMCVSRSCKRITIDREHNGASKRALNKTNTGAVAMNAGEKEEAAKELVPLHNNNKNNLFSTNKYSRNFL
jgi:hypothetical protein